MFQNWPWKIYLGYRACETMDLGQREHGFSEQPNSALNALSEPLFYGDIVMDINDQYYYSRVRTHSNERLVRESRLSENLRGTKTRTA